MQLHIVAGRAPGDVMWGEGMAERLDDYYDDVIVHHPSSNGANATYDARELGDALRGCEDKVALLGKSVGSFTVLKAIKDMDVQPDHAMIIGMPYPNYVDPEKQTWLRDLEPYTLFVHNARDTICKIKILEGVLARHQPLDYVMYTLQTADSGYHDQEAIARAITDVFKPAL